MRRRTARRAGGAKKPTMYSACMRISWIDLIILNKFDSAILQPQRSAKVFCGHFDVEQQNWRLRFCQHTCGNVAGASTEGGCLACVAIFPKPRYISVAHTRSCGKCPRHLIRNSGCLRNNVRRWTPVLGGLLGGATAAAPGDSVNCAHLLCCCADVAPERVV